MFFGWELGRPNIPPDTYRTNFVIANNTIICGPDFSAGRIRNGIGFGNAYAFINTIYPTGHIIKNNIIYDSPTAALGCKGPRTGYSYTESD